MLVLNNKSVTFYHMENGKYIKGNTLSRTETLPKYVYRNYYRGNKASMSIDKKYIKIFGVPETNFKIDLTIARGLDYYTGTVYETFLDEYRFLGSVCSGGRYDNLAEYYTEKKLPGVGISIGLSRLFFQLTYNNIIKANKKSTAKILIISMLEDLSKPAEIATKLRNNGINTQIYVEKSKIKKQFKYANNLEIPYVIVLGEDEINNGTVSLKNMQTGEQTEIKIDELCENPSKYLID